MMGVPPRITPQNRSHFLALARDAEQLLDTRRDPIDWIAANLQIRTKTRQVVPLRPNWIQRDFVAHRTRRDVVLKSRQVGITTMVSALFFADTVLCPNTTSAMLAHDAESTEQIFGIVQLFWERLPPEERALIGKPKYNNRRELYWPRLNSRFLVGTAGATTFGRGQMLNNLHCSEFAIWPHPEEALLAATEAVPPDGRIVIESTASGLGNPFHDRWVEAVEQRGQFAPLFYVWHEDPTYWAAPTPEEAALWHEQLAALGVPARVGAPPAPGAAETNLPAPASAHTPLTEQEIDLVRRHGVTLGQLKWARLKRADLRERFDQEYPSDWMSAFLASGRCIFDTAELVKIARRIAAQPGPVVLPSLPGPAGQPLPLAPATLLIWEAPRAGEHYVIGADVGEGLPDGDASVAVVLNRRTGVQAGELHGRVPPDRFGHLLAALGRYFHQAEIGVERDGHGHSTLNTLRNQCLYANLYHHVAYDSGFGKPRTVQLGWPTNSATRPILVDDLTEAINMGSLHVNSALLISECLTFILTGTGRAEAQPGKHDDRVMAAGIAWQIRKRPRPRMTTERPRGM